MQNPISEIKKNTIAEWFVRVILQDGNKKCVFVLKRQRKGTTAGGVLFDVAGALIGLEDIQDELTDVIECEEGKIKGKGYIIQITWNNGESIEIKEENLEKYIVEIKIVDCKIIKK